VKNKDIKMYNVLFKCPFTAMVCGPTGSGKTTLIRNLLYYKKDLFSCEPKRVIIFYTEYQKIYDEILRSGLAHEIVELDEKMISLNEYVKKIEPYKDKGGSLCIFDDCMELIDETNSKMFTRVSHHQNCNTIFISHAVFMPRNENYKMMSKNSRYFFMLKNPRDILQVKTFSSQIGTSSSFLVDVYKEATKSAYSYLLIDFHPETPEHIRLRSHIFPHEGPTRVYLQKNSI
jgi:energy-coupling factor transporter ATP-binding protein EcfA2